MEDVRLGLLGVRRCQSQVRLGLLGVRRCQSQLGMDYNKDEETALKEKEIEIEIDDVRKMITSNNYMDARDKLLEVQHHYPDLVYISEMISVCSILCTAEVSKLDYGTDWYHVLQVHPAMTETEIERQYNRIRSLLEPIKNNFPGTACALEIIRDAFSELSDPEKRPVFDLKRAASLGAYESEVFPKSCDDLGQICCIFKSTSFQREEDSPICNRAACETLDGVHHRVGCPVQIPSKCTGYASADSELRKSRWSAEHVASEQAWAIYDGADSMPRRYVLVKSLISGTEACVTFLDPHPLLKDEIYWVEENRPFVAGLFRASITSQNLSISRFSHLIDCEPIGKSFYKIYPRKGEVWAMYRNWNSRWEQYDFSDYECEIVEIISDLMEDCLLKTTSLLAVPGCMTFYQRQLSNGYEVIRTVSRSEMLSFSHRIEAFTVAGIEKYGIPKGSLHLDPDALPLPIHSAM